MRTLPSVLHPRRRAVLSGLLVFVVSVGAATIPSAAASAKPAKKLSETARIRLAFELRRSGASDNVITDKTGLAKVSAKTIAPRSTNTDVTVPPPLLYHDTTNNKYVAYAEFSWNDSQTLGDGSIIDAGNVGGYEALSIRFSQDVVQTSTPGGTIYWGGWTGAQPYPTQNTAGPLFPGLWDNSEEGASLQWQDRTASTNCSGSDYPSCGQYNSGDGYVAYTFKPPTQCTQIFGQYAHTWASTQITGVAVSNSGFEIQFSSGSNRWQLTSGATLLGC